MAVMFASAPPVVKLPPAPRKPEAVGEERQDPPLDRDGRRSMRRDCELRIERRDERVSKDAHEARRRIEQPEIARMRGMHEARAQQIAAVLQQLVERDRLAEVELAQAILELLVARGRRDAKISDLVDVALEQLDEARVRIATDLRRGQQDRRLPHCALDAHSCTRSLINGMRRYSVASTWLPAVRAHLPLPA
jgi:hypothetical protein